MSSTMTGDGLVQVSEGGGGGFASVRTKNFEPALDLGAYEGLELRIRGDGQRYKCAFCCT